MTRLFTFLLIAPLTACAHRTVSTPFPAEPQPNATPITPAITGGNRSWTFHPDSTPHQYQLTNIAIVKLEDDPTGRQDTVTTTAAFSLSVSGDGLSQTASGTIMQQSLMIQSRMGHTSSTRVSAVTFTSRRDRSQLTLDIRSQGSPTTMPCSDTSSAQPTILYSQLNTTPALIKAGDIWNDSITFSGCQGMVPVEASWIQRYKVVGETRIANQTAVLVQRIDSIQSHGEGSQQQHRVEVETHGNATTSLYIDPISGTVITSESRRSTAVSITTSGMLHRFVQESRETVRLIR